MTTAAVEIAGEREKILAILAQLYGTRESMRRANKPVSVHCLTLAIKLQTGRLRALDRVYVPL